MIVFDGDYKFLNELRAEYLKKEINFYQTHDKSLRVYPISSCLVSYYNKLQIYNNCSIRLACRIHEEIKKCKVYKDKENLKIELKFILDQNVLLPRIVRKFVQNLHYNHLSWRQKKLFQLLQKEAGIIT